jgi:photosystem II stability/assembly factor-like uncharacterized protein
MRAARLQRRFGPALAGIVSALLAVFVGVQETPPARTAGGPKAAPPLPGFEEPDAASSFERLKRRAAVPGFDTVAAYRAAEQHLAVLPRYSTRLGRRIDGGPGGEAPGTKGFVAPSALGRWSPLGPGNVGGRTRTLVIDPRRPDTMYCGGVSGGVWKTTDAGRSWTPIADRLANIAVNAMAMHPADPEVLYVGTGEGHFREIVRGTWLPLRGGGIFRTEDGGATWSRLEAASGTDFHWVNDLVISPHHPERLYAATRTGVHVSDDAGLSWRRSLDPAVNGGCLDLVIRTDLADDVVLAACGTLEQSTVYRLGARGRDEWEAVLSEPGMGRTSLAVAPSDPRTIYALAASNLPGPGGRFEQGLHAVYRSQAGGDAGSWRIRVANTDTDLLDTLLLTNAVSASYVQCGWGSANSWVTMGWYCNVIAVDPVDPDVVWAGGVDLFRSDDGGRSWGLASYWWSDLDPPRPSFVHADQHAIVFHPDYDGHANTTMFTANDGGVFRTDNPFAPVARGAGAICDPTRSAVRFEDLNHNLGITQFYYGAVFPGGNAWIGGTQDNGTILGQSVWGGDGWVAIWGGDGGYVAIEPADPQTLYVESQWFGLQRSRDGGRSFTDARTGVTEEARGFLFVTPFTLDPNDGARLWTGGRRLWRSDNRAAWWTAASASPLGSGQVSALAVAPGDPQLVLAGTTDGHICRNDRALEANGGTVWQSSRPRDGFVSSITFAPHSSDTVYATFAGFGGRHVWRSRDRGLSWSDLDGRGSASVPDIPVHSLVVDPGNPERLYLGTDLGVMTTVNGGRTWAVENTGFANAVTEWLAIAADEHGEPWLYAFTHGRGAWRVNLRPLPPAPLAPAGRRRP